MKTNKFCTICFRTAVVCLAVMCCGYRSCDSTDREVIYDPAKWEESQKPTKSVVSIHEIVRIPRGEGAELNILSYFEDDVCINSIQYLDSSEIMSIEAIPIPNNTSYNLRLTLTERGQKRWLMASIANKGKQLAFVIDGMMYRRFIPRVTDDNNNVIIIDGPFDRATAMEVQNNSKMNYYKMRK